MTFHHTDLPCLPHPLPLFPPSFLFSDPFFDEILLVPFSHVPIDDAMGTTGTTTGASSLSFPLSQPLSD